MSVEQSSILSTSSDDDYSSIDSNISIKTTPTKEISKQQQRSTSNSSSDSDSDDINMDVIAKVFDRNCFIGNNAFVPVVDTIADSLEKQFVTNLHTDYKKRYEVHDKFDYVMGRVKDKDVSDGELRLKNFENILESGFTFKRHLFQKGFHTEATKALAPLIVGNDWEKNGSRIIKERGWKNMAQMVMAKAPRRFGKSVGVGHIAIAFAEVMDGSTQAIFSTGRRASRNLLDLCYKFAQERGALAGSICRYNQEELWFLRNGKYTKIFSYPANAKVNKYLYRYNIR